MSKAVTPQHLWQAIMAIRSAAPLIHNITNFVVMQTTANALLSIGASPIMAHAVDELDEITGMAHALVLNIGTLSPEWVTAMHKAANLADQRGIPVVIDPVGAGASKLRTKTALALIAAVKHPYIRGNASEIMALAGDNVVTRGVDATCSTKNAAPAATFLAKRHQAVVCVSGEEDIITDGETVYSVQGGSDLMPKITGMGCTATALLGAFAAGEESPSVLPPLYTMLTMAICGEIAAKKADGPGSFSMQFIDALYNITLDNIAAQAKWRQENI